jgi:hypothetical protein
MRALTLLTLLVAGCRFTRVASVTIRNETPTAVTVQALLPGAPGLSEPVRLQPQDERVLLQYEESPVAARPIQRLVAGLRLATAGCTRALEGQALVGTTKRYEQYPRWTIRLTPAVVPSNCKPPESDRSRPKSSWTPRGAGRRN